MSIVIIILLAILIVFAISDVRAHRKHVAIQTVLHAELSAGVADLKTAIEKVDAKFDGGAKPK